MATETHADNSPEELLSAIKCLRLELHNHREEYAALSARMDRLFSTLEAKARRPNLHIDPPKFNGDDPLGWIYKVQSYFDYYEMSEADRLRLVGLLFEHRTFNWFLHQHDNNLLTTWPEFLEAVKLRFDPPRALKVVRWIPQWEVNVEALISGASTHNFVHPDVVKKFRWEVTPTSPPFRVYVGNVYGESLFCKQKCNNAKFPLQGHEINVVDFFVIPIHGLNMVLGAPWLKSLAEIYRNYDEHTMEFMHDDKMVTLRGRWEKGRHIFYNTKKG